MNGSGKLASELPFLPELLKQQGYDTAAFIAASPVLGSQFGLDRGFDTYDDDPARLSARTRPYGGERRDGEEVVDLALAWLKQRTSQPFFCWIHLYDAHGPYDMTPTLMSTRTGLRRIRTMPELPGKSGNSSA